MFHHHRALAHTVRVDKPNPVFARMLQQAIRGPEGEMRAMNQATRRNGGEGDDGGVIDKVKDAVGRAI